MYQQSIYTHIFKRDTNYYLYNSKSALFAQISQELYDEIVTEYESGKTLEYNLVLANVRGYGLQKVHFTISKE